VVDEITRWALAAAKGDQAALRHLIRATQADVWRFCAHLGDSGDADDLTQEVYLRAIKALPRFRGEASARTWLLVIARCCVADHIRAQQRRRAAATAAVPNAAPADDRVILRAVVDGLPEARRTAFVLTQSLGLSYAEAAEVCRCPVGTIRSRVARARQDLIAALDDTAGDRRAAPPT
jgi:RNA polymerase sigma-70 factor (ECF subfamily)